MFIPGEYLMSSYRGRESVKKGDNKQTNKFYTEASSYFSKQWLTSPYVLMFWGREASPRKREGELITLKLLFCLLNMNNSHCHRCLRHRKKENKIKMTIKMKSLSGGVYVGDAKNSFKLWTLTFLVSHVECTCFCTQLTDAINH